MTLMQGQQVPDLVGAVYEKARTEIRTYPCHSNRASALDGPCERELFYWRTQWEKASLHNVDLELIFREGRNQESAVIRDLQDAGVEVIEQQRPLEWKEYQITGHVDGVVNIDGTAVLLEIKSMADHIWRSVAKRGSGVYEWDEVAPVFATRPWLRKYYGQLQIYLVCKECEQAILLCKNKGTGALAQINVSLDLGYAEQLVQRAERINAAVAENEAPPRIAWDAEVCGRCSFLAVCHPDRVNENPLVYVEDSVAEEKLEQRATAEDDFRSYQDADKWVKEWVWVKYAEAPLVNVGEWLIEKSVSRTGRKSTKIRKLDGLGQTDDTVEE